MSNTAPDKITFGDARDPQTLLDIHDLSMDHDPIISCGGRLLKKLSPGYAGWFEEEARRKTDMVNILDAFNGVAAQLIVGACMTVTGGDKTAAAGLVEVMEESMTRRLKEARGKLLKMDGGS